jgi:Nickel responsive protein SCO4226-like
MPKFVIEREIPGAGAMSEAERRQAALKSIEALKELGPNIQWLHSYVTDNKVYCVYIAPDEETILKHAKLSGIPANRISRVRQLMDATSAE